MNARTTALSALIAIRRQNAWADGALKDYAARDRLDRRDAALAARLLYGVVQNCMLLDFYLAQAVSSPLAKFYFWTRSPSPPQSMKRSNRRRPMRTNALPVW